MLHITCDLCGKDILPGDKSRYVVKIEVFAAHDPRELTDDDLEDDQLEAVSQMIKDMDDQQHPDPITPACKRFRYDLCPDCQKKFLADPLNREAAQNFDFSEN